ncbi:UDP:flavonoid glycosyltransferase YjiC (YdhE family) [Actinoplanes octamycinicus]|uniref:UDP:flavonoid glycosyltransferase YjiC (YdhE family) n=1 Tax=Actinoplanes octamycinicus TaxID=135948 RepID=A0A7W7M9K8_9ACTN|nr:glycosyltransferase [Actinoplanes octamycinicus]MBB4741930.1 UDP:flavonoid glycosyltransferase YjiC (YdhE family) [Actinoplanes octamycinicus]GIE60694.1 glycosyl transferase [Actinoplanes octamycinicus]
MRIVFVAAPLQGHLLPLVPLAAACRDAGHDVVLAGGGFPGDVLGLRTADIGARFHLQRSALRVALRRPGLARAELRGTAGQEMVGELFGRANQALIDPLLALARRERPDLIVYESLSEAGAVVAARLGVPSVLQEASLWPATELFRAVAGSRAMRGQDVPAPALTIATTPPSLRGAPAADEFSMRPVPFSGGGAVPDWLLSAGDRPRVVVSRSTLTGPNSGDPGPAVIAAAAQVDAEFVLVRPAVTGHLPANVRTVDRVPLDRVLPFAAAFVHHGGAGSVLGGLAVGVPQLATPGAGDRRYNAGLLARRGAGLAVEAKAIGAADLTTLLTDGALRTAAKEVAAEIAAMPAPATVVPALEKL